MIKIGDIVRRLLGRSARATREQAEQLQQILTPDPSADPLGARDLASTLRAGRKEALAALLARLLPVRVANQLGSSEEARSQAAAVLNAPFPPRTSQSRDFIDAQTARIQSLEECVCLLASAIVEILHPAPREGRSDFHTTTNGRR